MSRVFSGKYPVYDERINTANTKAEVILGADDKHLIFRSCVGVEVIDIQTAHVTLGTRVQCKNTFGRFYMAMIDYVHRRYVSPQMLRSAASYAVSSLP